MHYLKSKALKVWKRTFLGFQPQSSRPAEPNPYLNSEQTIDTCDKNGSVLKSATTGQGYGASEKLCTLLAAQGNISVD